MSATLTIEDRLKNAADASRVVMTQTSSGNLKPEAANLLWLSIDRYRESALQAMRNRS